MVNLQTIARTEKIDCWILFPLMAVARMMPIFFGTKNRMKRWQKIWAGYLVTSFRGSHWQQSYRRLTPVVEDVV